MRQLQEGLVSQVWFFETQSGEKRVFRIAPTDSDFLHDKYAYAKLGTKLPVPQVFDIGEFVGSSFYCISEFVEGVPSDTLQQSEIDDMQLEILDAYAVIFRINIADTSGFGKIELQTGNGAHRTWREKLEHDLAELDSQNIRQSASNIGIDPELVDVFRNQAIRNMPSASEVRRLYHGDLGFRNMLVHDGKVAAFIDWAQIGFGDWMQDFSSLDFWSPGRHGDKRSFANRYGLDADHLSEREALYWAIIALETISLADRFQYTEISNWLRDNIKKSIVNFQV